MPVPGPDLRWELSIMAFLRKARKTLYFIRHLRKFRLSKTMMTQFYKAIIESVLTFSITTWFPVAPAKDLSKLQRVIRSAEQVIGCLLPPLNSMQEGKEDHGRTLASCPWPSHPPPLWGKAAATKDHQSSPQTEVLSLSCEAAKSLGLLFHPCHLGSGTGYHH